MKKGFQRQIETSDSLFQLLYEMYIDYTISGAVVGDFEGLVKRDDLLKFIERIQNEEEVKKDREYFEYSRHA